jgi:AraC family transcriptional regulator
MTDEPRTLDYGVTFDMVAAETACGQLLTLTSHRADDEIPPHRHTNDYVCIVLNGGFAEVQGNGCVDRSSGTLFAHHAGETHHDRFGPKGAMCVNLHFAAGDERIANVEGLCSTSIRAAANKLALELATRTGEELVMASLAADIMADIGVIEGDLADSSIWMRRVVEAISDEPRRRWTLRELARIADRHPVHVAQAFRSKSGMSLGGFQRVRRLVRLSVVLHESAEPLAMIASDFGYCDQSHMNSEFRAAFGTTPGQFRRAFH